MDKNLCTPIELNAHLFCTTLTRPVRVVCSPFTEDTLHNTLSFVYKRWFGAEKMWSCYEYGLIDGIPVVSGAVPNGKLKLIFEPGVCDD